MAHFGGIDPGVERSSCARRCRRTDARNATVGSDDQATSSTAVETNLSLKAVHKTSPSRRPGGVPRATEKERRSSPGPWLRGLILRLHECREDELTPRPTHEGLMAITGTPIRPAAGDWRSPARTAAGSTIVIRLCPEDRGDIPKPDVGIVAGRGQQPTIRRERHTGEPIPGPSPPGAARCPSPGRTAARPRRCRPRPAADRQARTPPGSSRAKGSRSPGPLAGPPGPTAGPDHGGCRSRPASGRPPSGPGWSQAPAGRPAA